jgi:hypothetical protein
MWFNKVDNSADVDALKTEIQSLKNENGYLKGIVEKVNDELQNAVVAINWKTMRAFSLERVVSSDGRPSTVIGYFVQEPIVSSDGEMIVMHDVVKEWTIRCSDARHNDLVKQFKAHNEQSN